VRSRPLMKEKATDGGSLRVRRIRARGHRAASGAASSPRRAARHESFLRAHPGTASVSSRNDGLNGAWRRGGWDRKGAGVNLVRIHDNGPWNANGRRCDASPVDRRTLLISHWRDLRDMSEGTDIVTQELSGFSCGTTRTGGP
jgi:hypothetical protein